MADHRDFRCCQYGVQKQETVCTLPSAIPEDYTVAMMYVPVQLDTSMYDALAALEFGTLFPVLNKPFVAGKCCK